MLLCDRTAYRALLRRLSLGDLVALYERTLPEYGPLADIIADELNLRLGDCS
jgi:hypothetical protein